MIQSRARFGFYGAIVPLVLVVLMYVGFFATSAVLGGSAPAGWWGIGRKPATIVVSSACTVLAVYGYRLIDQYERWISLVAALAFAYLTYHLLTGHHVSGVWHSGHVGTGTFLLVVAIAATCQITYARTSPTPPATCRRRHRCGPRSGGPSARTRSESRPRCRSSGTTFYTGPFVERLGEADVSWVIGLIVASGSYYAWTRPAARRRGGHLTDPWPRGKGGVTRRSGRRQVQQRARYGSPALGRGIRRKRPPRHAAGEAAPRNG
jgi:hypothetical protein